MYKPKEHYLVCERCGWKCQNAPAYNFYKIGDYCKECGKELVYYEMLYKQHGSLG